MNLNINPIVTFIMIILVGGALGIYAIQVYKNNDSATVQVQEWDNTTKTFKTVEKPFSQVVDEYPLLKLTVMLLALLFSIGAGVLIFTQPNIAAVIGYFVGGILMFAVLPYVAGSMAGIMSVNDPQFALFTLLWGIGVPIGLFVTASKLGQGA